MPPIDWFYILNCFFDSLSLSPNTAVSTDYQSLVNSLVSFIPGGATTQIRNITIVDDAIVENLEIFTVTATAVTSNVDIDPTTSATILIQDNDGKLSIVN